MLKKLRRNVEKNLKKETLNKLPFAQLSPFAQNDLKETWLYISANSSKFADKMIDQILQKCQFLAKNPKIGVMKDEIIIGLRSFPFKNYNIFYFQTESGVEIYCVLHSSRDNIQVFDDVIDETK